MSGDNHASWGGQGVLAILFILCLAPLVWFWFGWTSSATDVGRIREKRFFGRVIESRLDTNSDGTIDEIWRFSWKAPGGHHNLPQFVQADRNHDGRWDTWIVPLRGLSDDDTARYEVDMDGDSDPDWTFVDQFASTSAFERIVSKRGY